MSRTWASRPRASAWARRPEPASWPRCSRFAAPEGAWGFLRVLADDPRPERAVAAPGERWDILSTTCEPYPCGIDLNPVIDAASEIVRRRGVAVDAVRAVSVEGPPVLLERANGLEARGSAELWPSLQRVVAVTLLRGAPGLRAFTVDAAAGAPVEALRARVRALADGAMPHGSGRVRCEDRDGRLLEATMTGVRGDNAADERRGFTCRAA